MSNMAYCRFRNTLYDLADCAENIHEEVSPEEAKARENLIKIAYQIVKDFLTSEGFLDKEAIKDLPVDK